ncbi:hypothetical protein [Pedobacter sp. SYSU D00535]|nr:hypothetical protein [Pedobacter sp. SYSU D00535]
MRRAFKAVNQRKKGTVTNPVEADIGLWIMPVEYERMTGQEGFGDESWFT